MLQEEGPRELQTHRLQSLDLLRALAIFLVIGSHMRPPAAEELSWTAKIVKSLNTGGWVGVDLFFVLSGFLVSGLIFKEYALHQTVRPLHFLGRRAFKIYPGYYVLLLASLVAWKLPALKDMKWLSSLTPGNFVAEALFVGNYLPGVWNHTWSLAVEEHFYILLAAFLSGLVWVSKGRTPFRWIPGTFVLIAIGVLCLRIRACLSGAGSYAPTHFRIDSLFSGVCLAYFCYRNPNFPLRFASPYWRSLMCLALGAVAILSVRIPIASGMFWQSIGYTVVYLAFGLLLLVAISMPARSKGVVFSKLTAAISAVGFYSYSIYLWHMPVRRSLFLAFDRGELAIPYFLQFVLYVAVSILVGIGMAKLIEVPALRFRDRVLPSRSGVIRASSSPS
jgi:peptidoglycan/LPS O-acetylase OafA/YrhL